MLTNGALAVEQEPSESDPIIDLGGKDAEYWFQHVHARLSEARSDRKRFDSGWERSRKYYGGDHWSHKLRAPWKARPVANYIFADIETIIPIMLDREPTINVVGKHEGAAQKADLMQDSTRDVFKRNAFPEVKGVVVLKDAHMYGTAITKQWFDPIRDQIRISHIDTRYFFPAPGTIELQDAEYLAIVFNRSMRSAVREFKHLKGKLKAGVWDDAFTHQPVHPNKTYEQDGHSTLTDKGELVGGAGSGASQADSEESKGIVTQVEMWDRDENGQVWVTIMVNGEVARRGQSPYHSGKPREGRKQGLYPFARELCYPLGSQFWGMSEVAQLESPQDGINRTEAQVADWLRMVCTPYMRIHKESRVSLKDITNRLASFLVWSGNIPPDWMPPPSVPPELFKVIDNWLRHNDNLSAIHDAARGEIPASDSSGVAVKRLQEATNGRIKLKTRMFEAYLVEVAEQVIELQKQFYHDRVIRVGRQFKWVNRILVDEATKTARVDPATDVRDGDFDVEIGVGSTLPIDKGVRFEQSTTLREMGVMSKRQLLRDAGRTEDDVERILKEVNEETQEELKQQMAAEAGAAGGAPPAPADPSQAAAEPVAGGVPAEGGAEGLPSDAELAELEAEAGAAESA